MVKDAYRERFSSHGQSGELKFFRDRCDSTHTWAVFFRTLIPRGLQKIGVFSEGQKGTLSMRIPLGKTYCMKKNIKISKLHVSFPCLPLEPSSVLSCPAASIPQLARMAPSVFWLPFYSSELPNSIGSDHNSLKLKLLVLVSLSVARSSFLERRYNMCQSPFLSENDAERVPVVNLKSPPPKKLRYRTLFQKYHRGLSTR